MLDVLLVDDDPNCLSATERLLRKAGYRVRAVSSTDHALREVRGRVPDAIVSDFFTKPQTGGELLEVVARDHPSVGRVIYSSCSPSVFRVLVEEGIIHVALEKSAGFDQLKASIGRSGYMARNGR